MVLFNLTMCYFFINQVDLSRSNLITTTIMLRLSVLKGYYHTVMSLSILYTPMFMEPTICE